MENWEKQMAEIMELEDPRKAYIELALLVHREQLPLTLWEEKLEEYMKRHNVDAYEMAFYPDGERVVTPDMLW